MAKKVKFVPNRKEFQRQILNADSLGPILARQLGPDAEISHSDNSKGGGRVRARVFGSLAEEQRNGSLSRLLGG